MSGILNFNHPGGPVDPNITVSQYTPYLLGQQNFRNEVVPTKEKERIAGRLSGFNPKDNNVWREITQRFGASIKHPELMSIAQVLAQNANVKLDRDAKRRKSVLIKWFEENWTMIRPFLDYVVLEDSHVQR